MFGRAVSNPGELTQKYVDLGGVVLMRRNGLRNIVRVVGSEGFIAHLQEDHMCVCSQCLEMAGEWLSSKGSSSSAIVGAHRRGAPSWLLSVAAVEGRCVRTCAQVKLLRRVIDTRREGWHWPHVLSGV